MSDKKTPVFKVIDGAKKPQASKGNKESTKSIDFRFESYGVVNDAFYQFKWVKDEEVKIPLCDFVCQIDEEITHDTGLEDKSFLLVSGKRKDGLILPSVEVPAKSFYSSLGSWMNDAWGTKIFVYPGASKKDNLRAAIHLYSKRDGDIKRRDVYGYCGWKKIHDQWHYLTGSGAITARGLVDSMQVDLGGGHMKHYSLPNPDQGQVKSMVSSIYDLMNICPDKPHIGRALLSAVARAPLGECHPNDFAIFIHGLTGAKKSEIAAISLAFFGDFNARRFPSNWSDTENDIEAKAFSVKDSVFVVDDFKPSINTTESARLHAKAERFVRNTGNQAGRGRRGADMQSRPAPYNRSMTVITGEDLPKGQSLLGRLLVLELSRNDVDVEALTRLQQAYADGHLCLIMSTYLQWLAPQIDDLKKSLPHAVSNIRNTTIKDGFASSHPRAPEIFSNLVAGAELFFDFLNDIKAVSFDMNNDAMQEINNSLINAFQEQSAYQSEQDEVKRFFDLLRSLFSSGNAHVSCRLNQGPPPSRPHAWGWRVTGTDMAGDPINKPMGDRVGWYCDKSKQIWLDQNAAFACVQQLARTQGDSFLLSASSLWRRMNERQLILATETRTNGTKQLTVKRTIAGSSRRVMIVSSELVESG